MQLQMELGHAKMEQFKSRTNVMQGHLQEPPPSLWLQLERLGRADAH